MMRSIVACGLIVLTLSLTTGCEKARLNRDTTTSEDHALAEGLYNDLYVLSEESASQGEGPGQTFHTSCATITIDPIDQWDVWPKTITVDFGTGCTGKDGRFRTGMVEVVVTGPYRKKGTVVTTTPINYTVDNYAVDGIKRVTNAGRRANGNLYFTIEVENGSIETPDGETITWSSSRERDWLEGEGTTILENGEAGLLDDVYSITGGAQGVNRDGRDFTVNIAEALRVELDCSWIVSGTLEIEPDELKRRTINFGNGDCDREAEVSIGNFSATINMR